MATGENGVCGLSAVKFVRPEHDFDLGYVTIPDLTLAGNSVMIRLLEEKRACVIHTSVQVFT